MLFLWIFSASLMRIRGNTYGSLDTELDEIISAKIHDASAQSVLDLIKILSSRAFMVPFSCVGAICILFRLSGFVVISHYTANCIEFSGTQFDPLSSSILIGAVRLVSSLCLHLILGIMSKRTAFIAIGSASTLGMLSGKLYFNSFIITQTTLMFTKCSGSSWSSDRLFDTKP